VRLKTISLKELARDTEKVAARARKQPVLVCTAGQSTLILRALSDDDLADELIVKHPDFRASIRRARRNRAAGKGVTLAKARRQLKV